MSLKGDFHLQLIYHPKTYRQLKVFRALKGAYWSAHRGITYLHAWLHRRRMKNTCFIGITGSAGKTSTKDLSSTILSTFGACNASPLTKNEHLFIARTILDTKQNHRFCAVEVAGHEPGYMDRSLHMLKPDIGVLTIIGRDHYKAFKSLEGIAAEKGKLIKALPVDGTAVLNIDDPLVKAVGEHCQCRIIWIGESKGATIRLLASSSNWPDPLKLTIEYEGKSYEVLTQLHGTHLSLPVLSALGVALAAGIPLEKSIPTLAQVRPSEGRMQIVHDNDGVVFIRDDLKAPAWSLQLPLEFLKQATAQRKVAVIGSISDFSGDSSDNYKKFARRIRENADLVVFVGPNAHRALRARKDQNDELLQGFSNIRDASIYLKKELRKGDLVLLKGSYKVDHLSRLILDRIKPIHCWRERCGYEIFCEDCEYLYDAGQDAQYSATIVPAPTYGETSTPFSSIPQQTGPVVPVIVGLGNPGIEFHTTPHNVGYQVLDKIVEICGSNWEPIEEGWVSLVNFGDNPVKLFKPAANMNVCGPVIRRFLERTGCSATHCTIVHDDMDLELGKVRFKDDGGDAGHRGVKSVIAALGTDTIRRIRIGVRRPGDLRKAREIVLTQFTPEETLEVAQAVEQLIESLKKQQGGPGPKEHDHFHRQNNS